MRFTFNMVKSIAVILAGGVGSRMGLDLPKQFYKVADRTILEHSVDAFEMNPDIDSIFIVTNPMYVEQTAELIEKNSWYKVTKLLQGGKERYDSSLAAIEACYEIEDEVNLIFHDAVRPLVSQRIISECVRMLKGNSAVGVAVPSVDTILEVKEGVIASVPDRSLLWRAQTPQGFRLSTITEAYLRALQDPDFKATDDCGVVLKYMPETPIYVVRGEESNIKFTYREDIPIVEELFRNRKDR